MGACSRYLRMSRGDSGVLEINGWGGSGIHILFLPLVLGSFFAITKRTISQAACGF